MKRIRIPATVPMALAAMFLLSACGGKDSKTAGHDQAAHAPGTGQAGGVHSHDGGAPHSHGAEDTSPLPTTLPGIWAEVQAKRVELNGVITSGELAKVHGIAFRIRDLVAAMPPLSAEHLGDKASQLKDGAVRTADIARLLDQYGDAGDGPATEGQVKRLDAVLDFIGGLYPAGTLGQ